METASSRQPADTVNTRVNGNSPGGKTDVNAPDPNDYSDPEEFYEDNKDYFPNYDAAEEYYYEHLEEL